MLIRVFFALSILILSSCNHDGDKKFDCAKSTLKLSLDSITNATACGISDGAIYFKASGGKEPYSYALNNQTGQTTNFFSGLPSGIYSVQVSDQNGCSSSLSNLLILAEGLTFSADVIEDTDCLANNGSITLSIQEGNRPFTYKLGSGTFSSDSVFENLAPGQYAITVKDALSCDVKLNVTVPKGATGVSWSSDILPIMTSTCAVKGCHDGKTRIDYRLYSNVKKNSSQVKSKTRDKSMPFDGPALTADQINLISCWVDDGALDN